jgi:hypothetical protein
LLLLTSAPARVGVLGIIAKLGENPNIKTRHGFEAGGNP